MKKRFRAALGVVVGCAAVCGGWVLVRGWGHGTDRSAAEAYDALYESRGREGDDARWRMEGLAAGAASVSRSVFGSDRAYSLWAVLGSGELDDPRLQEASALGELYRGVAQEGVRVGKLRWVSAAPWHSTSGGGPPRLRYDVGGVGLLDVRRAMLWEMRLAAGRGDWERVEEIGRSVVGLSDLHSFAPSMVSYLLHLRAREDLWEMIRVVVSENEVDAGVIARMEGLMEAGKDAWEVFARGIEGESLLMRDSMNYTFTSRGFLNARGLEEYGRFGLRSRDESANAWEWLVREARWAWMEATSARRGEAERAVAAWRDAWLEWASRDTDARVEHPDFPSWVRENPFARVAAGYLMPEEGEWSYMHREMWEHEDARAATRATLRLAAYRASVGTWPQMLTEAMSVAEATRPSTGKMFFYCRAKDGRALLRKEEGSWPGSSDDYGPGARELDEDELKEFVEKRERRTSGPTARLPSRSVILRALVRVILNREGTLEELAEVERQLVTIEAPAEEKSEAALRLVEGLAGSNLRDRRFVSLLTEAALPRLRELVRESGDDLSSFHMGAASALAHLGDVESLAMLREKGESVRRANDSPVGSVGDIVWCIEIQHPPEKLLEFLSAPSADDLSDPRHMTEEHARAWAVRRAMELGLGRERVRARVFAYVEKVRGLSARTERERGVRDYLLSEAKRVGVAEGALEENELAWIRPQPTARVEY